MRSQKFFGNLRILLFALALTAGCVVGFLLSLRPAYSEDEKRDLTPFPAFTLDAFLSGEWTEQVSLWYADTYPGRDALLSLNDRVRRLYGLRTSTADVQGRPDEIPDDETVGWDTDEPQTRDPDETGTDGRDYELIEGYYVDAEQKAAFELYFFHKDISDRYARMVANAARRLDGTAEVYDMVVPLSYCYHLDPDVRKAVGATDGFAAVDYLYRAVDSLSAQAGLTTPVVTLDAASALGAHKDEYVFFRTDHHWTELGAFYASRVFLDALHAPAPELDAYTPYVFRDFWGSLYAHTKSDVLLQNPDSVEAWAPQSVSTVTITTREGDTFEAPIVRQDAEAVFSTASRYRCFVDGDYPLYEIHNESVKGGPRVLVIKESYGNAFLPVIADSFEYVYAIDYRFYSGSLVDFVAEHDVDVVLFLNNLVATGDSYNVGRMESLVNR